MMQKILSEIEPFVFYCRDELHQIPEIGNEEFETANFIKNQLDQMGVKYEVFDKTGIIGRIEGINAQKTIAFRADMDALPIREMSTYQKPSKNVGFMHACGHDAHMSILLGFIRAIMRDEITINDHIVFIFQPAEEGPGGAEKLVKSGLMAAYKIDCIYGMHVFPDLDEGKLGVCKGPAMAMVGEVDIDIHSKSCHGAMPHLGKDAVTIGSECVMGLQTIVSRNIDPLAPVVLTIGKFTSGERRNILSGHARLEGTLRAFDKAIFEQLIHRMDVYLKGIASAYEVEINIDIRRLYPPVINDDNLFERFYALKKEEIVLMAPQMISEDFSYYQQQVPGLFFFLGTKNLEQSHTFPLHNAKFNLNNSVMLKGIQTYLEILLAENAISRKV